MWSREILIDYQSKSKNDALVPSFVPASGTCAEAAAKHQTFATLAQGLRTTSLLTTIFHHINMIIRFLLKSGYGRPMGLVALGGRSSSITAN